MKKGINQEFIPENIKDCESIACSGCTFGHVLPPGKNDCPDSNLCVVRKAYLQIYDYLNTEGFTPMCLKDCDTNDCKECVYYEIYQNSGRTRNTQIGCPVRKLLIWIDKLAHIYALNSGSKYEPNR